MLQFFVYAALTTGALQVLLVTRLCLFASCSCHRGFTGACSDKFVFICMLLLPLGLYRCLNLLFTQLLPSELCRCLWLKVCVYLHAALAVGASQMLEFVVYAALTTGALQVLLVTRLCLFACCSCYRGFAGACSDRFVFMCMLLLPSGLYRCLNLLFTQLLPSELCRCLWLKVCVYLHAALAIGALQMLQFVVYAALTTGALQVLLVTRLCLFACCSCYWGFAGACSDKFVFICMLLLPSGLYRCLDLLFTQLLPSELRRCLLLKVCV